MSQRPAGTAPPILGACAAVALSFALAACHGDDMPAANQTGPVKIQSTPIRTSADAALQGTPMAQRVAVIGLLNKRNGLTRDLTMKPGEALRVGDAIVRLQACETTAPWENVPETGAFVQLDVRSTADGKWRRNFSGWLFKERPDRNVVQHPIYDVWVKSCAMEWPETGPATVKLGGSDGDTAPTSGAKARSAGSPEPADKTDGPAPSGTASTAGDSNAR
jgi:hypothetical protein